MLADNHHSLSFSDKLRSSVSCFRSEQHDFLDDVEDDGAASPNKASTPRSPCSWLKSTANELPELLDRCRNYVARIGRSRRRYNNSVDFSYDSSSYALNFEDDCCRDDDEFPLRRFTAKLPASFATVPENRVPTSKYGGTISACG